MQIEKKLGAVPHFNNAQVLVVGDVMLDRYWHGTTARISPEAPVPVVQVQQKEDRAGGAQRRLPLAEGRIRKTTGDGHDLVREADPAGGQGGRGGGLPQQSISTENRTSVRLVVAGKSPLTWGASGLGRAL